MKPVTVEIEIPQNREEIFDFLDVLGNREGFTDHLLVDWTLDGSERGVGARARMFVKGPRLSFRFEWLEAPLIERLAAPLTRSVIRRAHERSLRRLAETLAAGTNGVGPVHASNAKGKEEHR